MDTGRSLFLKYKHYTFFGAFPAFKKINLHEALIKNLICVGNQLVLAMFL